MLVLAVFCFAGRILFGLARPKRPWPMLSFNEWLEQWNSMIILDTFISRKLHSYSCGTSRDWGFSQEQVEILLLSGYCFFKKKEKKRNKPDVTEHAFNFSTWASVSLSPARKTQWNRFQTNKQTKFNFFNAFYLGSLLCRIYMLLLIMMKLNKGNY